MPSRPLRGLNMPLTPVYGRSTCGGTVCHWTIIWYEREREGGREGGRESERGNVSYIVM